MEPNPSFSKPQRLTWNLSFTIFVVTLGTWYAGGFFNMALNVPQTYIVSWIRWVECGRHPVHDNHTSSFILWCNTLTDEEAPFMLRDNIKLNTIWAVLSSTYGIGTLVANFASTVVIRRMGLIGSFWFGNAVFVVGSILSALICFFHHYELLLVGRLLCGLSQGTTGVASLIYISEVTPVRLRGAVSTFPIIMMVMGMLTANVLGLPFLLGTEERWFMLITIQGIPVLVMCAFLPFCPDSPRRLFLTVGNKEGAVRALVWLRGTTDVHVEIDQMNREQTMMKEDSGKDDHKPVTLMGIFRDRYLRNIFWMCAVPMFAKQFSGYMCIFYYSTSIFNGVGLDHLYSGIATCGVWATYLVFSLVSMALVDRAGRKTLLLISHTGMIIGMSLFTVFMVLSGRYQLDWAKFGCAGSLFFYIASYAIASGSIPFFLPNEMFPQNARTAAQTWNGVLCSGLGLITSMLFPIVVFLLEEYTFLIFVASMALATVYLIWKLPETKGKSIDEIQTLLRRRLR